MSRRVTFFEKKMNVGRNNISTNMQVLANQLKQYGLDTFGKVEQVKINTRAGIKYVLPTAMTLFNAAQEDGGSALMSEHIDVDEILTLMTIVDVGALEPDFRVKGDVKFNTEEANGKKLLAQTEWLRVNTRLDVFPAGRLYIQCVRASLLELLQFFEFMTMPVMWRRSGGSYITAYSMPFPYTTNKAIVVSANNYRPGGSRMKVSAGIVVRELAVHAQTNGIYTDEGYKGLISGMGVAGTVNILRALIYAKNSAFLCVGPLDETAKQEVRRLLGLGEFAAFEKVLSNGIHALSFEACVPGIRHGDDMAR